MKTLSAAAEAALRAGSIVKRRMVKFEFASGTYAFWDGLAPITPSGTGVDAGASGVTFQPGGSLIDVTVGQVGTTGEAPKITLALRAVPNSQLSPDKLASIFAEAYQGRRVSVFRALIDVDTAAIVDVSLRARGYLDQVVEVIADNVAGGLGDARLEATVENRMIEWNRAGGHDRNHESQIRTFPGDRGLGNLDRVSSIRKWGKGATQ
jgi:hypothetical protein